MATVKIAIPNLEKFQAIKSRVNDLYGYSGETIRKGKMVRCTAHVLLEIDWLLSEIKRLGGSAESSADPERFKKIARYMKRVVDEQQDAILAGEWIDLNASLFSAMRFLVRDLQVVITGRVDEDVADELAKDRLIEERERISLDLAEGIADLPDDDDKDDDSDADLPEKKVKREFSKSSGKGQPALVGVGGDEDDLPGEDPAE